MTLPTANTQARTDRDVRNTGANATAIAAVRAAMNGAGPVGGAASGLGGAIHTALTNPNLLPVARPTSSNDPTMLVALLIAMAIIQALWCFIKSLLNPLPIIGSFFPLCDPDDNGRRRIPTESGVRAANATIANAVTALDTAHTSFVNSQDAGSMRPTVPVPTPALHPQTSAPGKTWDEHLVESGAAWALAHPSSDDDQSLLRGLVPDGGNSSADVPPNTPGSAAAASEVWNPGNESVSDVRKLFGL